MFCQHFLDLRAINVRLNTASLLLLDTSWFYEPI